MKQRQLKSRGSCSTRVESGPMFDPSRIAPEAGGGPELECAADVAKGRVGAAAVVKGGDEEGLRRVKRALLE